MKSYASRKPQPGQLTLWSFEVGEGTIASPQPKETRSMATKTAAIVTKDSLNQMLQQADPVKRMHIIGRALVALFNRQTRDEQSTDQTNRTNTVGFASSDAKSGSICAKTYIGRQMLIQWQVDKWMTPVRGGYPRICKYSRQLNDIAVAKAETSVVQRHVPISSPSPESRV